MTTFVQANITTDPDALLDTFIDTVNANLTALGYPNWSPSDADLAVIIGGVVSQIAADINQTASTVAAAIFRAFGTQLCAIPYVTATNATVTTTWTFTSPAPSGGYTINAGTGVLIDGYSFYVQAQVTTPTGAGTASVLLVSSQPGTAYNGLAGINVQVDPVDEVDWVQSIVTTAATAGGTDQQSDADYMNTLAAILQLQAPRPITAADYAGMVLSNLCIIQTGIVVGRATAIDGWYPAPRALSTGGAGSTVLDCTIVSGASAVTVISGVGLNQVPAIGAAVTAGSGIATGVTILGTPPPTASTFSISVAATASVTESVTVGALSGYGPVNLSGTATTVSGSTTVTGLSGPYLGSIPAAGATVIGSGIPVGDTVAAAPPATVSGFSLVSGATSTNTGETITVSEWTTVSRCVAVFVTDVNGNALSTVNMDALQTWLQGYREINFLVFVEPPNTTTIYVTAQIHVLPGFVASSVVTSVEAALLNYLNPATWGNATAGSTGSNSWLNYTQGYSVVRFNSIIGIIEGVPGVQYAVNGQVFLGTTASPNGTSDITLTGAAPLVASDVTTPTIVITAV